MTRLQILQFIPLKAQAGFTDFESPAAEYAQSDLDLAQLLIDHPTTTCIGYTEAKSMVDVSIYSADLLIISNAEEVKNNDTIVANLNQIIQITSSG